VDQAAVGRAFESLTTYDHGSSRGALMPIDDAVVAAVGDAGARKALEQRLAAVLRAKVSPLAKQYVCSKLGLIGSADSVPALAELLAEGDVAHAARSALESIPCPEAIQALRDSLPKLAGLQKVGIVDSLGARRDAQSVLALTALLEDPDRQVASAALAALGNIGTPEAAQALQGFLPKAPEVIRLGVADALLACAERLLADGKKAEALAIYKALADPRQPKPIRVAASRGILVVSQKP
jgi:HEAT repeat protein